MEGRGGCESQQERRKSINLWGDHVDDRSCVRGSGGGGWRSVKMDVGAKGLWKRGNECQGSVEEGKGCQELGEQRYG